MSPARAASSGVVARALGPSSSTSAASVSGPRELLITTSCPLLTESRASWLPMRPAPMSPMVVMAAEPRYASSASQGGAPRRPLLSSIAGRELGHLGSKELLRSVWAAHGEPRCDVEVAELRAVRRRLARTLDRCAAGRCPFLDRPAV